MKVRELMHAPAITCHATDPLNKAAQLMWENDCGALPVVENHGSIVGMITDRDICMAAYTKGVPLSAILVADAMATHVFAVREDDSIHLLRHVMSEKKVRRVPVIDGDSRPVGLVSLSDVARAAARDDQAQLDHEVVSTIANIASPRAGTQTTPSGGRRSREHQPTA